MPDMREVVTPFYGFEMRSEFPEHLLWEEVSKIPSASAKRDIIMLHHLSRAVEPGGYYLEVGSFIGKSAVAALIAGTFDLAVLVDLWAYSKPNFMSTSTKETYDQCWDNVSEVFSPKKIRMVQGDNRDDDLKERVYGYAHRHGKYGLIYIDGNHDYHDVVHDIKYYVKPLVPTGGYVAFHDYHPQFPGAIQAINELLSECDYDIVGYSGRMLVLRKIDHDAYNANN